MPDSIDVRVTPSLHPDTVREIDGYDEETAPILGPVETAFSEAYIGIGAVHDARDAASKNPTWNEAGQLIHTSDFAEKKLRQISMRFDSVAAGLQKTVTYIEGELSAPVKSTAAQPIAAEIRAYAKSLSISERMGFVRAAIVSGDQLTARAVLGAPAYLSGLDAEMSTHLTRMFHEHDQPALSKRLKAAQGGLDLIGQRGGLVFGQIEKAVGANPAKIAKLRAAKNAAEKHFAAQH